MIHADISINDGGGLINFEIATYRNISPTPKTAYHPPSQGELARPSKAEINRRTIAITPMPDDSRNRRPETALVDNVVSVCISSLDLKTNLKHCVELMERLLNAAGDLGPTAVF